MSTIGGGITFTVNDKRYWMAQDGDMRIQIGTKSKSGKIKYKDKSRGQQIGQIMRTYEGINVGNGYIKRLSYRVGQHHPYKELHKVVSI